MWDYRDPRHAAEVEADRRYAAGRVAAQIERGTVVVAAAADLTSVIQDAKERSMSDEAVVVTGAEVAAVPTEVVAPPEVAKPDPGRPPAPVVFDKLVVRGLADKVQAARKGLQDARAAAGGLGDSTRAFVAAVAEVQKQIDAARDDLIFEATTLGNS